MITIVDGHAVTPPHHARRPTPPLLPRPPMQPRRLPVVHVLLERPPARVHEEVSHGGDLQSELGGDGRLNVLVGSLRLLEDSEQGTPLDVREDEAGTLAGLGGDVAGGEGGDVAEGGEGGFAVPPWTAS